MWNILKVFFLKLVLIMHFATSVKICEKLLPSRVEISSTSVSITNLPCENNTLLVELRCRSEWCRNDQHSVSRKKFAKSCTETHNFHSANLLKFTDYVARISVGDCSRTFEATKTEPGRPTKIRNFTAYFLGMNAVGLRWLLPFPPQGIAERYKLVYKALPQGQIKTEEGGIFPCNICSDYICASVNGLEANTTYSLIIKIKNKDVTEWGDPYMTSFSTTDNGANISNKVNCLTTPVVQTTPSAVDQRRVTDVTTPHTASSSATTTITPPHTASSSTATPTATEFTIRSTTELPNWSKAELTIWLTACFIFLGIAGLTIFFYCRKKLTIFFYCRKKRRQIKSEVTSESAEYESLTDDPKGGPQQIIRISSNHVYEQIINSSSVIFLPELKNYLEKSIYENLLEIQFNKVEATFPSQLPSNRSMMGSLNRKQHYNIIVDEPNSQKYIIPETPIKNNVEDFWLMVWKRHINKIIRLDHDNDKYWPEFLSPSKFEDLVVLNNECRSSRSHTELKFSLTNENEKRSVSLYSYCGEVSYNQELANFIKKISFMDEANYFVVDCGSKELSGALVLCNMVLKTARSLECVDCLESLITIKKQQPSLVRHVNQYTFGHLLLLDWYCQEKFSFPIDGNFEAKVDTYLRRTTVKEIMEAVDLSLSLYRQIVPHNHPKILLGGLGVQEVQSCFCPRKFIVTKQPCPKTVASFWKLVHECDVSTIVSLNRIDSRNPNCLEFWKRELVEGFMTKHDLDLASSEERDFKVYNKIKLKAMYMKSERTVQIISMKTWQRGAFKPDSSDILQVWEEALRISNDNTDKPILLTCLNGSKASGLFIALCILLEKISEDRICDVYSAVRLTRTQNPEFVLETSQFEFLHKTAVQLNNQKSSHKKKLKGHDKNTWKDN